MSSISPNVPSTRSSLAALAQYAVASGAVHESKSSPLGQGVQMPGMDESGAIDNNAAANAGLGLVGHTLTSAGSIRRLSNKAAQVMADSRHAGVTVLNPVPELALPEKPTRAAAAAAAKPKQVETTATTGYVQVAEVQALPLRVALQSTYRVVRRDLLKQAVIFCVFLFSMLWVCWDLSQVHAMFSTNTALADVLLQQSLDNTVFRKNFWALQSTDEVIQWLAEPLYRGVYGGDLIDPPGVIRTHLHVVGGVQLRQARVRNDSCIQRRYVSACVMRNGKCEGRFDTKDGSCFAEFADDTQDMVPFGPNGMYVWTSDNSFLAGLFGFGPSYGYGGYVTIVPPDPGQARKSIAELINNLWIDRGTRVVAVTVNAYNSNLQTLTVMRLMFEFFESGEMVQSAKTYTTRLVLYRDSTWNQIRAIFELLYALGVLYFFQREIVRLYNSTSLWVHLASFEVIVDILMLLVHACAIYYWAQYLSSPKLASFNPNSTQFVDYFDDVELYILALSWLSLGCALGIWKLFRYLALSKNMNSMFLTLQRAAVDLLAFVIGFTVVVAGFAFAAYNMFGFAVADLHTMWFSFSAMLRYALAGFNYTAISDARPWLAPIFFVAYTAILFMVMMNMFIAVITKYFDDVHEEAKKGDRWKKTVPKWKYEMAFFLRQAWVWTKRKLCRSRPQTGADDGDGISIMDDESVLREAEFLVHVDKCAKLAQSLHGIDLYEYLYRLHLGKGAYRMYVGVAELCSLTQEEMCIRGKHGRRNCAAHQLLFAYNRWKNVTLVDGFGHQLLSTHVLSKGYPVFLVRKTNTAGFEQSRQLCIDTAKHEMYSFDMNMRLRRRIPARHLCQLATSVHVATRLQMVFTDLPHFSRQGDEGFLTKGEVLYEVRFLSKSHRDQFAALLLRAKQRSEAARMSTQSFRAHHNGGGLERHRRTSALASADNPEESDPKAVLASIAAQLDQLEADVAQLTSGAMVSTAV